MEPEPSDETLMRAYASGDAEAFEALYARHRVALFRFLFRHVRLQATAETLFEAMWRQVILARDRFRPEGHFVTWLYRMATGRLAHHWRASVPHGATVDDRARREGESNPAPPGHALSVFEERRRLQLALESLPSDQREAVVLRLEQSLPVHVIVDITGAAHEAVESRLRQAMGDLKTRLAMAGEPINGDRQAPLDDDERALARVLRALPAGEPPSSLDARLLALARDAVVAMPEGRTPARSPRTMRAFAVVAACAMAAGLAWHLGGTQGQGPGVDASMAGVEHIRERIANGDDDGARASLEAYIARHPGEPLPQDLTDFRERP